MRLRVGRLTLGLTLADRWECSQATGLPAWRHQDLSTSQPLGQTVSRVLKHDNLYLGTGPGWTLCKSMYTATQGGGRGAHGRWVKEYVAQLRMEYVRALERRPVIVVGDFNYDPRRRGAETEVDREVRRFVEEMTLQDVSYSGAPGPSHYPAPESSAPSRIDAVYADPSWVKGVTAGYMVGP